MSQNIGNLLELLRNAIKMGKLKTVLIIFVALIVIGLLIAILIGQQAQPQSVSRAVICGDQRDDCYYECNQKFIEYFCENECDENYQKCMNDY